MAYSAPYILLLVILGISSFFYEKAKDKENKLLITLFAIFAFYIFFAFRGYVYSDWTSYSEAFKNVEWEDILNITNKKRNAVIHEPGFTALMCVCSLVTREYAFLVIVITTIDLVLFLRFLKRWNVSNISFALMLFFTFEGVILMFDTLRNQLAIFIFINALEYIYKKKPLKYFFICFLALCFHSSALVYFPLYFFLDKKLNKWVFLGLILGFFLFYISQISIVLTFLSILGGEGVLGEKAEFYTEFFTASRAISPTGTIEKFVLTTLLFLYYGKLTQDKTNVILINSLILCYFFYYMFGEFKTLSNRLAILFEYPYWILWIRLMAQFEIQNNRRLLGGFIFLYCLYATTFSYNMPIQEYDNLLFGAKSQAERAKIFYKTAEDE